MRHITRSVLNCFYEYIVHFLLLYLNLFLLRDIATTRALHVLSLSFGETPSRVQYTSPHTPARASVLPLTKISSLTLDTLHRSHPKMVSSSSSPTGKHRLTLLRSLAARVKRALLPWLNNNNNNNSSAKTTTYSYDFDAVAAEDENALNEALEARLSEAIARAAPLEQGAGHARVSVSCVVAKATSPDVGGRYYDIDALGEAKNDFVSLLPAARSL